MINNKCRCYCSPMHYVNLGIALILCTSHGAFAESKAPNGKQQVVHFGPGVHKLDNLVLSVPNSVLEGVGKGVTILVVPNGILCTATNPIVRGLTIVGTGKGVGLTLQNTWSAQIIDVAVESFAVGVKLELNEEGRKRARVTLRSWPSALTSGLWGSRVTLTEFRGVDICGDGDGLVMQNLLKDGNNGLPGEFFTGTTLWGGHIVVKGRAIVVGNNVWNTKIIGTYIDIGPGGGVFMAPEAQWLDIVGVSLDLNYAARKSGAPKVTVSSFKAMKSFKYVATNLNEDEIYFDRKYLAIKGQK